jgi:hypothetical protein
MLLIVEDPDQRATRTQAQDEGVYGRMVEFGNALKSEGVPLGVESLAGHSQAARVKVRGGKAQVLDGRFAEAKEMIGGFFLLDVDSRDQAVAIAARCPASEMGHGGGPGTGPLFHVRRPPAVSISGSLLRRMDEATQGAAMRFMIIVKATPDTEAEEPGIISLQARKRSRTGRTDREDPLSFPDSLFAEWRVADRAASAMEAANARTALDALAGIGPPVSAAQRFKTVALRAVADDLFRIALALMKARAEMNLKS